MRRFLSPLSPLYGRYVHAERFAPLYLSLGLYLAASAITRLALLVLHLDQVRTDWLSIPLALLSGLAFDGFIALCLAVPFALFLVLMPDRWLAAPRVRFAVGATYLLHIFALIYLCVAEVVFFEEFNSRFNFVAVDYLIHPREVAANIRDTYPVYRVLLADAVLSVVLFLWLRARVDRALRAPAPRWQRPRFGTLYSVPVLAGGFMLNINSAQISDNRVLNEIAGNGVYSFFQALATNEVDYDALYARRDETRAFARLRRLIGTENARFVHPDDPSDITREVRGHGRPRPMNVVLVLEESLGSKFVGSLHPEGPSVMRELDALAKDGLFFTRIYATGNRTVRGIEASLTGLPPLPGRSVVKRNGGAGLFTLPSVLRAKGYQTVFLYGGRAYFDNIREFALNNGYERVVDQNDFRKITFSTIWGVCDEDLFDNALADLDALHARGKPFFATLLTVSNHTPFTYPKGRIPENPDEQRREFAMRYADYALGKFMRDARAHGFFDNTLFVFLGDHGARVYGAQEIPMDSYEIPVLFYAPKLIAQGRRVDILGSQMDVAPTLLGLLDMDYRSQFFGRDLRRVAPDRTWALMSHNRDVALLRDNRLAVLGVRGVTELWERDPASGKFRRLPPQTDPELIEDAIAYYQSAAQLYQQRRLRALAQTPLPAAPVARRSGDHG